MLKSVAWQKTALGQSSESKLKTCLDLNWTLDGCLEGPMVGYETDARPDLEADAGSLQRGYYEHD